MFLFHGIYNAVFVTVFILIIFFIYQIDNPLLKSHKSRGFGQWRPFSESYFGLLISHRFFNNWGCARRWRLRELLTGFMVRYIILLYNYTYYYYNIYIHYSLTYNPLSNNETIEEDNTGAVISEMVAFPNSSKCSFFLKM